MIYFFALLLIAASWTAVFVMKIPMWIAIAVTASLVVLIGIYLFVRWYSARKAARQFQHALNNQADEYAQSARPEQQADIQAMQAEFQRAVSSLKSSKLGRNGVDALTALPWYVIIGPPGAGKTTVLRNSGLRFPYEPSSGGGGLKGVAGTRNCEWWLANEAVLLDTAGRYSTEDDDRDEWFAFLDATKRSRPKHPINGLIVAVSIGEIIEAENDDIALLAKTMRDRIDEVMQRLEMVLPVYLVFTKSDLLSGFVESFGDMRPNEREQIWGFTLPLKKEVSNIEAFAYGFDDLMANLGRKSFARVGEERRLEARAKIFEFPDQVTRLRAKLGELVETLFAENIYQETPIMRGAYFTSGTQEGRPLDQITSAIADAFGILPNLAPSETIVDTKSYFIHDLFTKVIFPDQNISGRSETLLGRRRMISKVVGATAFTVGLFFLMLPGYAYLQNQELVTSTTALVDEAITNAKAPGKSTIVGDLERMREKVDLLHGWTENGPPTAMGFGMYQGDAVYPKIRDLYALRLRSELLQPLVEADVKALAAFGKRYESPDSMPSAEEYQQYSNLLRLYLQLTFPKEANEPKLSAKDQKRLLNRISQRISVLPTATTVNLEAHAKAVVSSVKTYLELLQSNAKVALERDPKIVLRVRNALNRVPIAASALDDIIASFDGDGFDLSLNRMIGGAAAGISTPRTIRGAFTRRAWEERIEPLLAKPWDSTTDWVLGAVGKDLSTSARDIEARRLRSQYFDAYINEWMLFLQSIRVARPKNRTASLAALQDLTRGKPPVWGRLMKGLDYNIRLAKASTKADELPKLSLDLPTPGAAKPESHQGENFTGPAQVLAAFRGFVKFGTAPPVPVSDDGALPPMALDLDIYQEQLTFVRDALQMELENPSDGQALMARIKTARTRIKGLIASQETGWRPRFQSILWPPVEGVSSTSSSAQGGIVNDAWCSRVVEPYKSGMAGKYPFRKNGDDVALGDIAQFYRPASGTLATFFADTLSSAVSQRGNSFTFSESLGQGSVYKGNLLKFLKRSQGISKALFPTNSATPLVKFSIRIKPTPNISSVSFSVDGQKYEYRNGPEQWHSFQWPGDGSKMGAALRVKGAGVNEYIPSDGEWGLFRLLEDGQVLAGKGRSFTIGWQLSSVDQMVKIEFRPARSASPFFGPGGKTKLLNLFRSSGVKPPSVIAQKGGRCSL